MSGTQSTCPGNASRTIIPQCSSATSSSQKAQTLSQVQSATIYTLKPALFGVEFTLSWGVTKTPGLRKLADIQPHSSIYHKSTKRETPDKYSRLEMGVLLAATTFVVFWLVQSIAQDIVTFIIIVPLLGLIFGGCQMLEAHTKQAQLLLSNENLEVSLDAYADYALVDATTADQTESKQTESAAVTKNQIFNKDSKIVTVAAEKTTGKDVAVGWIPNQQLAVIQQRHGYPVFHDGDEYSEPCGRPIDAVEADLNFIWMIVGPYLPQRVRRSLQNVTAKELLKTRASNGESPYLSLLELHWFMAFPEALGISGDLIKIKADVIKYAAMSRMKYTPACPIEERNSWTRYRYERPYLTEKEELEINEGIVDFNYRNMHVEEETSVFLRAAGEYPGYFRLRSNWRILFWLDKIPEEQCQLDPDAYYPCNCGKLAQEATNCYRNEKEHHSEENKGYDREFPTTFLAEYGLPDVMLKEPEDAIPARSQTITQCCDIHKMKTSNIYILVDTSVEDINNRLSNPGGPLPAPGLKVASKYLPGFKTTVGYSCIPYRQLPPRCNHGFLHKMQCQACFPRGHLSATCKECLEHGKLTEKWTHLTLEELREPSRRKYAKRMLSYHELNQDRVQVLTLGGDGFRWCNEKVFFSVTN